VAQVKICGLTTQGALDACAGADFVGFNFCKGSPRYIAPQAAARLRAPEGAARVGLFVNADDAQIAAAAPALDMLQLHGAEGPARVAEVRARFGLPIIKALVVPPPPGIEGGPGGVVARCGDGPPLAPPSARGGNVLRDLIAPYEEGADWLLLDGSAGGQGVAFDWSLLDGVALKVPWMLAGGLTPGNVACAIARARPDAVDVSSGVERARGVKDAAAIRAFIRTAQGA
jgi:phosphoribosylanthranilate isomerase